MVNTRAPDAAMIEGGHARAREQGRGRLATGPVQVQVPVLL